MKNIFFEVGIVERGVKNSHMSSPMIEIVLDGYITINNKITLTPELATDEEIDFYVNQLIKNLESVRKKAKQCLKRENEIKLKNGDK